MEGREAPIFTQLISEKYFKPSKSPTETLATQTKRLLPCNPREVLLFGIQTKDVYR